uniref:Uncharacterized protein n=1 Tax=Noctiluca scintillans TaxID=2966 RepID=A0A7S1FG88_NOCSC|mmetsp:Transcript_61052/g.162102  ORF Transcript_61052/g.162102 Transcript_61052/m.162102 type:complete len:128 (+) Transcript_61052:60-443(+)|eukprot:CAMPEP_0194548322 /NCGR_PEP_ID=MMETSP0253-20130528/93453_1 /TAXON_ID=2966 /ORGANISM="Noctiluca scintillans" /LENGTH=127 /DNA_ID=CAMNT_0039395617 /DNA_START=34 /DNA_END=417 /DNA_ORIENTATION=+
MACTGSKNEGNPVDAQLLRDLNDFGEGINDSLLKTDGVGNDGDRLADRNLRESELADFRAAITTLRKRPLQPQRSNESDKPKRRLPDFVTVKEKDGDASVPLFESAQEEGASPLGFTLAGYSSDESE